MKKSQNSAYIKQKLKYPIGLSYTSISLTLSKISHLPSVEEIARNLHLIPWSLSTAMFVSPKLFAGSRDHGWGTVSVTKSSMHIFEKVYVDVGLQGKFNDIFNPGRVHCHPI